jgi:hypothetical protein
MQMLLTSELFISARVRSETASSDCISGIQVGWVTSRGGLDVAAEHEQQEEVAT